MDTDSLHITRHSFAHVLAAAVLKLFPEAKFGVGPVTETGSFYDILLPHPIKDEELKNIEKQMKKLIGGKLPFERREVSAAEAKDLFAEQPLKLELIHDLEEHGTTDFEEIISHQSPVMAKDSPVISVYTTGDFTDLCRGPHVENTKDLNPDAFKVDKVAGAYWRGNEKNAQLQRIYLLAFETKPELDAYLAMREEASKRDHKKLGPELDLFTFSDLVGAGLPLWTPKGTLLRELLDAFVQKLRAVRGYVRVEIPHITKKDLYVTSGHWTKFKDDLFRITTREEHEFAMKPMNCPHHTQIYARKLWSYRDLPQRYANTTMCYRDEQTGELSGLARVRSITQDDAHVFCRMNQARDEFLKIWDIVHEFYAAFGFSLTVRLSRHDPAHMEKYLGEEARWQNAEDILKGILDEKGVLYADGLGEAAFYGPKLDFMAKDSLGREWQVATIQLDMNMPENFDLTCINEKGEKERIVMIHAAIMGAIERFLAILIEHTAGVFPLWLSPVQAAVLSIGEKHVAYARKVAETLKAENIRAEVRDENDTIGKKIRACEKEKIPYILVVGDKEAETGTVAVRERGKGDTGAMPLNEFIARIKKEVEERK